MANVPAIPTVDKIYNLYKERNAAEPPRKYLGCSEVGQECPRRLWYSFRNARKEDFDGRILRLFETGHLEEARLIQNFRDAGVEVHTEEPETGKQWRFSAVDGHLSGGLDGVGIGFSENPDVWHLIEIKTHSRKNFNDVKKNGVEKSKPVHFVQCQLYMGLAELQNAVYGAVCKDSDEIYLEWLKFEPIIFKALILKATRVIRSPTPIEKIAKDASFYLCKFCPYVPICHGRTIADCNCRTCLWSSPGSDGKFDCAKGNKGENVCENHLYLPEIIQQAATPQDVAIDDVDHIEYETFANITPTAFPVCSSKTFYHSEDIAGHNIDDLEVPF